ncbi:MAG: hypothetical protein H0U96_09285 [Acidobacteria bacterium]|nr:hypothetical protein [Acidobacteriota bacterium]
MVYDIASKPLDTVECK